MNTENYESYWCLDLIDRLLSEFASEREHSDVGSYIFGRNMFMLAQILFERYPDMSPEDIRLIIKLES